MRNALSGAGSAARIDEALARPPILIDRGDDMSTLNVPGSTASMGDTLEDALLDINHLTFTYPGAKQPALNDVTFSVKQGEFVNIVGPSGCGKSTMLSLLMTIAPTTLLQSGTIRYKGVDLRKIVTAEISKK
ncbi:MAG TPA: ATP-binding cassette domain-containing protein [Oculatellaceae cyanobacterium]